MNKTLFSAATLTAALLGSAVAGNDADALDASLITKDKSFLDRFSFGSYGEVWNMTLIILLLLAGRIAEPRAILLGGALR